MKKIEEYVRSIPDFPEPGIIFRDITSVLNDADGLQLAIDSMDDLLKGVDFDGLVGTEFKGLKGRERLKGYDVASVISYEGN